MSLITLVAAGIYQAGGPGTPTTPVVSGAYLAGDLLMIHAAEGIGSDTLGTPAGYALFSADAAAPQSKIFLKVATSNSETLPLLTWSGSFPVSESVVHVFRGVDPGLISGFTPGDRTSSNTASLTGPASPNTPAVDGCLIVAYGHRNKTSQTDGVTLSAPANFTMLAQDAPNGGTRISIGTCYWIQSAATTVPANITMLSSLSELVNEPMQAGLICLRPVAGIPSQPVLSKRRPFFVDETLVLIP